MTASGAKAVRCRFHPSASHNTATAILAGAHRVSRRLIALLKGKLTVGGQHQSAHSIFSSKHSTIRSPAATQLISRQALWPHENSVTAHCVSGQRGVTKHKLPLLAATALLVLTFIVITNVCLGKLHVNNVTLAYQNNRLKCLY